MDSYIIRIYRFKRGNPKRLVGTVEMVGIKGKMAFTSLDELWEVLSSQAENLAGMRELKKRKKEVHYG